MSLQKVNLKVEIVYTTISTANITPCQDCSLRYICGGDCRIDNFNFKGHLKSWNKEYVQTRCTDEFKERLIKKMVDSFTFYYNV